MRDAIDVLDDMHRAHTGQPFGCACVDGEDTTVGNRSIDHTRVEHAGQMDVRGVLAFAGGLRRPVITFRGLANVGEFRVCGKRRRLALQHYPLFLLETILRNAPNKTLCAIGSVRILCA